MLKKNSVNITARAVKSNQPAWEVNSSISSSFHVSPIVSSKKNSANRATCPKTQPVHLGFTRQLLKIASRKSRDLQKKTWSTSIRLAYQKYGRLRLVYPRPTFFFFFFSLYCLSDSNPVHLPAGLGSVPREIEARRYPESRILTTFDVPVIDFLDNVCGTCGGQGCKILGETPEVTLVLAHGTRKTLCNAKERKWNKDFIQIFFPAWEAARALPPRYSPPPQPILFEDCHEQHKVKDISNVTTAHPSPVLWYVGSGGNPEIIHNDWPKVQGPRSLSQTQKRKFFSASG